MLHAVPEFIESAGRQRRLKRRGPDVPAPAEWGRRVNILQGQALYAWLPGVKVVPGKGQLLFRRNVVIEPGGGEVGIEVIGGVPRKAITVKVVIRNLPGKLRDLVVDGEDRLRHRIESCPQSPCGSQIQYIGCSHHAGGGGDAIHDHVLNVGRCPC